MSHKNGQCNIYDAKSTIYANYKLHLVDKNKPFDDVNLTTYTTKNNHIGINSIDKFKPIGIKKNMLCQ